MPETEEPVAPIFVEAAQASYGSETQAILAAVQGLSEQFSLSVQLDSALPRAKPDYCENRLLAICSRGGMGSVSPKKAVRR